MQCTYILNTPHCTMCPVLRTFNPIIFFAYVSSRSICLQIFVLYAPAPPPPPHLFSPHWYFSSPLWSPLPWVLPGLVELRLRRRMFNLFNNLWTQLGKPLVQGHPPSSLQHQLSHRHSRSGKARVSHTWKLLKIFITIIRHQPTVPKKVKILINILIWSY